MENNIIATENFILVDGDEKHEIRLELSKSGAFDYGNGTCMGLYLDGKFRDAYDTRYNSGCNTPEKFHKWSMEFIENEMDKRFDITRVRA